MELTAKQARLLEPELRAARSATLMLFLDALIRAAASSGEVFVITDGPNGEFVIEGPFHRYPAEVKKVIVDLQESGFEARIEDKHLYVGWD